MGPRSAVHRGRELPTRWAGAHRRQVRATVVLAGRASRMPYQTDKCGIQRTTTVTSIRPFSWSSSLDQLERIRRICLIRMRPPTHARPCHLRAIQDERSRFLTVNHGHSGHVDPGCFSIGKGRHEWKDGVAVACSAVASQPIHPLVAKHWSTEATHDRTGPAALSPPFGRSL
jgi:hypothetical protein